MKSNRFVALISIYSILLTGCSVYRISSEDTSSNFYPSKSSISDVVYLERVQQPHESIGHVTVNAERRARLNDIIEKMKIEAAILGADAITNIQTDSTGTWKALPAQAFIKNGYVRANYTATAVVLK